MERDGPFGSPFQAHFKNELDGFGGLRVYHQLVFILRVLDIAIGSHRADILAVAPLVVKYLPDFFRGLIAVIIVDDVGDRNDNCLLYTSRCV